ncbi:serine protease snake-like, partial [Anopheles cruzii]|uniref:serine protease snake-like n=1 Tax=Anopheles cruzii TaxID=68878 RepID=UPI0022EC2924
CETYRQIITRKQSLIPLTITPTPIVYEIYNCTNVVQLIVGGEQAKYGEFPHHALLGYPRETDSSQYDFRCGGTLISDRHVLTAAHCFSEGNPAVVRLGEYDTANVSDEEVQFGIEDFLKHPQYSNTRSYHDIALIRLDRQVWLTKYVRPACLWDSESRNITRYVATGFGYNETIGIELSTTMMKVQLDEFPVDDCARAFAGQKRFRNGVQAGQICVGSIVGGKDTCQGDSGGPLQVLANPKTCIYHVVGITSTGGACGVGHSKAIYTKVSYYLDWIEDHVWGDKRLDDVWRAWRKTSQN